MAVPQLTRPASPSQRLSALLRDLRFLQAFAQAVFLVLVILAGRWLIGNLFANLDARGLGLSFSFLNRTAGFTLSDEVLSMQRTDTFLHAYVVGLANTLEVVMFGLILASFLGLIAGVAMLSSNWLLRNLFKSYVEVMRNTPLLLQLFFFYSAVILKLPSLADRLTFGPFILSNRGFFLPRIVPQSSFGPWLALCVVSAVLAIVLYRRRLDIRLNTGRETYPSAWALLALLGPPVVAWLLLPGQPAGLGFPALEGLRIVGGARLSPEFAGILLGLVLYTGAFIADIVRAGIQAVPHGQQEAALASGLSQTQTLRLVVLPQALRVIVPPTTNQYLNLAKNSSLAVGVGFPDLYAVSQTIFNQSGQAVQVIALMMSTYLVISLVISALMNLFNSRLQYAQR